MALDVHLKRMGNSTWEFRLVGKKGFNISVTEAQVPDRRRSKLAVQEEPVYSSPSTSSESSEEDSQPSQQVSSGLYDPVLDDTEVIYETIGPADSDQPSNQPVQPTEVQFEIKQFTDQPELTRSLTSSPFPISVKPYRPFSTEPLEIPPVEDPIILNPNYKDVFALQEFDERPPETRFKLPISAQYDPTSDPTKETVLVNNKIYIVEGTDTVKSEKTSDKNVKMVLPVDRQKQEESIRTEKEEHEYIEIMKKEIDLDKIEATAFNLVDESMQQAVTIAEKIKKEIDAELKETVIEESNIETVSKETIQSDIESNVTEKEESVTKSRIESIVREEKTVSENEILSMKEVKETKQIVNNLTEIIDETTDSIIKQKEIIKINEPENDKNLQKENLEKNITKKEEKMSIKSEQKHDEQATSKMCKESGTKMTTSKLLAEQRAYTIGLQTIPNIRGSIQSSNHYNLLLKTFFVHLTDVMVALSRFILTESALMSSNVDSVVNGEVETNINNKTHKQSQITSVKNETKLVGDLEKSESREEDIKIISNTENKTNKSLKNDQITTQQKANIVSESIEVQDKKHNLGNYEYTKDSVTDSITQDELKVEEGELIRNCKLSGAKIAQIEGRKSADLTDRMDKVISEFQRKSGTCEVVNNVEHTEDHRRSRSRSKVEEELYHENVSSKSVSYIDSEKKSLKHVESQSEKIVTESGRTQYEGGESENVKSESNGKLTYVAIVEAHVYTNKDAIFEEQMRRMSENSKTETSAFESVSKMSIIKDAKEESVEELLLAKNIESSTKTSLHKSVAQAHAAIETPMKSIAAKTSVALEKEHEVVQNDQLISKKSHVIIEKPVKTLAEKSETVTEEYVQVVDIPKIVGQSPKQAIETPIKTVAEVKEVFVEEEKAVTIETPVLYIEKPKCTLDSTAKAVAQKTEILIGDNTGTIEANFPIKPPQQAKVIVNESAAAVVTEISPLEESKSEIEIPKLSTLKADVQIEAGKVAAQATIIALEETGTELNKKSMLKSNQANLTIAESMATSIAETTTVSEVKQEAFKFDHKSAKVNVLIEEPVLAHAKVQDIKVEDAKCEITDVTDSAKNIEEVNVTEYSVELPKEEHEKTLQEESAALQIVKHQIIEVTPPIEIYEDFEFDMKKIGVGKEITQAINIHEQSSKLESSKVAQFQSASSYAQSKQNLQRSEQSTQSKQSTKKEMQNQAIYKSAESSVAVSDEQRKHTLRTDLKEIKSSESSVAVSDEQRKLTLRTDLKNISSAESSVAVSDEQRKLTLRTDLKEIKSGKSSVAVPDEQRKLTLRTDLTEIKSAVNGANDQSPSPPTVPPTPLVDEYMFKLEAPLPKNRGPPVPRDCSVTPPSEHEDLDIVKKKLVPQIVDTNIEQVIYDPPLPTPTSPEKKSPPKFVKPGLRGGSDRPEMTKEEIMEIERKSSLLTSAIDETIRSIEEYKESVGIEMNQEVVQESIKNEFSSEVLTEKIIEENGIGVVSNGYVEEDERELSGSEEGHHEVTIVEETQNQEDESEQSIVQTVVLNGSNGKSIEYKETTNGDRDFNEEKHDDVVETVTINLSKIKRDSLQEATLESKENNEKVTLNGDIKHDDNNKESSNSDQLSRQSDRTDMKEVTEKNKKEIETKTDPLLGYRPVEFNPEAYKQRRQLEIQASEQITWEGKKVEVYKTDSGEIIGSQQGIIDGLEEPIVDPEIAKELGKPGMPEEKVAELISGEAEMLREAHVMGLARVLKSHMHRTLDDDCSVDFKKIKPYIESLKDSEVLKALNEEILRSQEEKKKEERKWTTFLQKPVARPKQKIVFCGNKEDALNYDFEEPYRVKIVKQPKPRIAPDFKPEDFDTGPLPWEQRALVEDKEVAEAPPVEPEEPILIPEDVPEFVEAVDPLPESEVPDLEDTGIPLPPSPLTQEVPTFVVEETQDYQEGLENHTHQTEGEELQVQEEAGDNLEEMDKNKLSEQLMTNIESMVDPNATLEEQLAQMREQLATLAQLPNVIQQTLELVTKQISQISQQKTIQVQSTEIVQQSSESHEQFVDAAAHFEESQSEQKEEESANGFVEHEVTREETQEIKPSLSEEEQAQIMREEQERMMEEQRKLEQQKKELIEQMRIEQESRLVKQRSTPRVGKPRPMFGPPVPVERPVFLPGGRKWRRPEDAYNEQQINEALTAQAEVIKGKAIGDLNIINENIPYFTKEQFTKSLCLHSSILRIDFWNNTWPWGENETTFCKKYYRVNFMKYEKPPVSLDHLQQSEVYKVVHNMDQTPLKRVEMLTPVIAEADYRERARSATPCSDRMERVHFSMPQQLQP